tara:strand:- start:67 stop:228 length:162 start_codon:yes stop_codon:yes gene_type:complete
MILTPKFRFVTLFRVVALTNAKSVPTGTNQKIQIDNERDIETETESVKISDGV